MISSKCTDATACFCSNCNYLDLAGYPADFIFDPSDQELIVHLESMVLEKEGGGSRAHPLIHHFIATIEGEIGICYTHPENLPGVTRDGLGKHFFYRTKAYRTNGTRMRRKIMPERGQRSSEDVGEAHWYQAGNTRPVIVGGRQKGFKKILVLYNVKQGKRESTHWVMHQYHLGMTKKEKDGELVVSKVFYRCPDVTIEQNDEKVEVAPSDATPNILPVSGAAEVTAATVGMVFQETGVLGDLVLGDQGQVHVNNHYIPSQHDVQSVHMEPDTTLSLQVGVGDPVSYDQGKAHGDNHVKSVDLEQIIPCV